MKNKKLDLMNKKYIKDMKKYLKWKEKRAIRISAYFLCAFFIFVAVGLAFTAKEKVKEIGVNRADPDKYYGNCKLLAKDCIDAVSCGLNIYCGDVIAKDCRVYDCGNNYGVYTKDQADKINFKTEAKPDESAAVAVRNDCSGTMQIISQECKDNKNTETKLKLNTKGKCELESIATIYEDSGAQPNTFTYLDDGTYSIVSSGCGKITQIIPAAKGGIGLEFEQIKA